MAPTKKRSKYYKPLPPHSNGAHPLARMGEVNKTLVISIIVILGLVVLALLLFVAQPFAGKAVALPPSVLPSMSIGASIPRIGLQSHAASNEPFSFPISANLVERDGTPHETVAISFQVTLPNDVNCPAIESLLGWIAENGLVTDDSDITCVGNLITFTAATANPFMAKTGLFEIARLSFAGLLQGTYSFSIHDVTVIDLATGQPLSLAMHSPSIIIQTPVYECTGTALANTQLCAGDDQGLIENTPLSTVPSCTDAQKCEYTCTLPLILQNNVCVRPEVVCTGEQPANTRICDGDSSNLEVNTPLSIVVSCTDTVKCELVCNAGFHIDNGACVADTFSCTGAEPANAVLCDGDNTQLPVDTSRTLVDACTANDIKCEYRCDAGFELQGNTCIARAILPSALGTKIRLNELEVQPDLYRTTITATENVPAFTVVTELYSVDQNQREKIVLVESRNVDPLQLGTAITISTKSLGEHIVRKQVIIYDTPNPAIWTVHTNEPFVVQYEVSPQPPVRP